jgi:hypothetical protein
MHGFLLVMSPAFRSSAKARTECRLILMALFFHRVKLGNAGPNLVRVLLHQLRGKARPGGGVKAGLPKAPITVVVCENPATIAHRAEGCVPIMEVDTARLGGGRKRCQHYCEGE